MALLEIKVPGSNGATHTVKRGQDGIWYCSCPAWRFQRVSPRDRLCKHLTGLATELAGFVGQRLELAHEPGRRVARR